MPEQIQFRSYTLNGRPSWPLLLAGAIAFVVLGILLTVIAVGVLVFLVPALLIVGLISIVFPRARGFFRRGRSANAPSIIDAEYRIVDKGPRA